MLFSFFVISLKYLYFFHFLLIRSLSMKISAFSFFFLTIISLFCSQLVASAIIIHLSLPVNNLNALLIFVCILRFSLVNFLIPCSSFFVHMFTLLINMLFLRLPLSLFSVFHSKFSLFQTSFLFLFYSSLSFFSPFP